jgi:hypothetical protein
MAMIATTSLGVAAPAAHGQVTPKVNTPMACASTDKFSGSIATMEAFMACSHIPYRVYTNTGTTATPQAVPMAGGPSCQWQSKNVVEICSVNGGQKYIVCVQYFAGNYYPYHCGPGTAYSLTHAQGLWDAVKALFTSHNAQACVRGAIAPAGVGAIFKSAGSLTGIGIIIGTAIGCVGGIIAFNWKIPSN